MGRRRKEPKRIGATEKGRVSGLLAQELRGQVEAGRTAEERATLAAGETATADLESRKAAAAKLKPPERRPGEGAGEFASRQVIFKKQKANIIKQSSVKQFNERVGAANELRAAEVTKEEEALLRRQQQIENAISRPGRRATILTKRKRTIS